MKIYIIADTHFFHENIIKYCYRPFNNIEEQDRQLIARWNSTVSAYDLVLHLGDISLSKRSFELSDLLKKLNGRKILVQGNHDRRSRIWYLMNGFDFVCDSFIWDGIIFTHRPILREELDRYKFNIHGHIHEKLREERKYINVGVEHLNYTPINLQRLLNERNK